MKLGKNQHLETIEGQRIWIGYRALVQSLAAIAREDVVVVAVGGTAKATRSVGA